MYDDTRLYLARTSLSLHDTCDDIIAAAAAWLSVSLAVCGEELLLYLRVMALRRGRDFRVTIRGSERVEDYPTAPFTPIYFCIVIICTVSWK